MFTEPTVGWWILALLVAYRLLELGYARRNTRALVARGARIAPGDLTGLLVGLHLLVYGGTVAERVACDARLGAASSWIGGGLLIVASIGRAWTIATLGRRWTIRILTVSGEEAVRAGPYRLLRHPNYVAVMAEVLAVPLLFHAWWTLAIVTIPYAAALWARIRREEAAWRAVGAPLP
ncbi:MAG: isoprenylcysteine carboxylmethyltransferase family protein [Planctomycetota bacterium]|jgi:methyltransferase